ncbi:MAG: hypothetical protein SOW59_04970, partial [Corynebacterium sp.]|nr:hypothetical protein [Corynebacterium sp.]
NHLRKAVTSVFLILNVSAAGEVPSNCWTTPTPHGWQDKAGGRLVDAVSKRKVFYYRLASPASKY